MVHSMCCSSRDLQPPICSNSSSSSEFGYAVSDFLQHTHFYSSSAHTHTHTHTHTGPAFKGVGGWAGGRFSSSSFVSVSLRPSFYVWFLLDSCCKKREKEKNLLKKSPTFFCSSLCFGSFFEWWSCRGRRKTDRHTDVGFPSKVLHSRTQM